MPAVATQSDIGTTSNTSSDGVVVDKTKTNEQYLKEAEGKYIVPRIIREKYPDLIKLLYETESMNDEEREYWLQIMPIMTEDQITKLRDIMVNERDQLQKLASGYSQSKALFEDDKTTNLSEEQIAQTFDTIEKQESVSESTEESKEAELLKELESF